MKSGYALRVCALTSVALMAGVSAATAGGFYGSTKDIPSYPNWSGLYVGVHGGYGWTDIGSAYNFGTFNDVLIDDVGLADGFKTGVDGYVVGGHIGLQRQIGKLVIGIEGTASATDMDGSSRAQWGFDDISCGFGCFGLAGEGTQSLRVSMDNLLTVTGRLGYAYDKLLLYVKGGYASADIDVASSISGDVTGCFFGCITFPVSAAGNSEKRHDGSTLGGGIETMIRPNLTIGIEYGYIDLGARTHSIAAPLEIGSLVDLPAGHKVRIDPDEIHTVTLRVNFLLEKWQ